MTSPLPGQFEYKTLRAHAAVDAARPHRRAHVSRDLGQRRTRRFFEEGDSLFSRHAGKVVQEHVETVSPLDVVDKCTNRYARTDEHRIAAVNLRIGVNDRFEIW